ncbi:MAG: tubulin/FtsZ family protein [Dehalococcoidales bacterium]|jgi:cell division GTPase FtsZ|nr:tubulin/FtsZ family protein [Dehalococcoidales bacterium]
MKLVVVGLGQCGGRIADEFARLSKRARAQRGMEIVTGAFAVNTDAADLSGLQIIRPDYQHRILVGGRRTGGHGVGKINELGAEVAREDGDKVVDALRTAHRFFETDAFLLIAGVAGGTGSGALPIITQMMKDRYIDKPVYTLAVLPFAHEEETEERTIYNAATCLKSLYTVADAVFLADNQRFVRKDFSLRNNLSQINTLMVEPFYNLLCAGEETNRRHIGARMVDAGDIIQSLVGWTVIGYGKAQLPSFKFFSFGKNFRKKSTETHRGIQAMDEALSELSVKCNPAESGRALYLVSAPHKEMNMDLVKDLGEYLRDMAPEAVIRNGDYPREKNLIDITLVLSELGAVDKIKGYYESATQFIHASKGREKQAEGKLKDIEEASKDIPSLL